MSLLANTTNANATTAYFLKANAQLINVSTLNAGTISTGTIEAASISTASLEADMLTAYEGTFSTFSTSQIVIDSQTLNATPTELLLNGVPVATQSSLSSIADWSLDPAISTVQMLGNDLNEAGLVSSQTVRAGNGLFNNLVAFNSLFVSSNTSTISSLIESADLGIFSTISAGTIIAPVFEGSTITVNGLISTPDIEVSTINGAAFGTSSITVDIVGVSTLVATSISSVGAAIRQALLSTIVFSPSLNPSLGGVNVNLGLGGILGNVIGWGAGVFGAAVGTVALATSMIALTSGRQTNYIDNSRYELVNGATQLQFSSLGTSYSTIYRFNNSTDPERVPGEEIFISTIYPPGLALRSVSDPINTLSTPNSTIQMFGQWVPVPEELINFSTFSSIAVSSIVPLASSIAIEQSPNNVMVLEPSTITIDGEDQIVIRADNANSLAISGSQSTVTLSAASSLSLFAGVAGVGNIQMYAPNVVVDQNLTVSSVNGLSPLNADWANYPAVSTIKFSTGVTAAVSASAGSDIALLGVGIKLIGAYTDAYNKIVVSTISTAIIEGANNNLFGVGAQGLEIRTEPTGTVWISSPQTNIAGLTNTSTVASFLFRGGQAAISAATLSSLTFTGLSSIVMSTSGTAGTGGQPAGRLMLGGNDLDLGQQDLWAQQVRVGAGNPGGSAQTEVIWYSPDNLTTRGLGLGGGDLTLRLQSTLNSGTNNGYLLDTAVNKPFFSTINNSTCMMATIPSTNLGVLGVSTLAIIPPIQVYGSFYSSTSQTVVGANTITPLTYNSESLNVGGFTFAGSTITIPAAGTYEITHSIQFDTTSGGTNEAYFWLKKNGTDIPQSGSIVSIVNNGETLGTISLLDTAAANDQYAVCIASSDANMTAKAVGISSFFPAIPSLITNIKRL